MKNHHTHNHDAPEEPLNLIGPDRLGVKYVVLPLLKLYKVVFSPILYALGSRCRFYPSCSTYSVIAFRRHGLLRGFGLSVVRIAKCNPLHPGGFDAVPPRRAHDEDQDRSQLVEHV